MDEVRADDLAKKLVGETIDGWIIERLQNYGKSAAVFLGRQGHKSAAIKIFDDELIGKYGDSTQLSRIERELKLIGHNHPNLVNILGGGVDSNTGNHFIAMDFLDGPNLAQCLKKIPVEQVSLLIAQLSSAARFLEELSLVHRDIKPENICVLENYSRLVLLDFGVIRPVGESGPTDGEGVQLFVGTLQYSSPEFLLRKEEDTEDGWRALTYYQIGGVLHDLIMRRPLFADETQPFARLVNAVQFDKPIIRSTEYPPTLIDLAERCLIKDPKIRSRLLNWSDFDISRLDGQREETAKERVIRRAQLTRSEQPHPEPPIRNERRRNEVQEAALNYLSSALRTIRNDSDIFPPANVVRHPPGKNQLRIRLEPIQEVRIQGQAFDLAKRRIMSLIMARRMKATTVRA